METAYEKLEKVEYSISKIRLHQKTKPDSRERLLAMGADCLSTQELMMVLLGSGTEKMPVQKLAGKVLQILKSYTQEASVKDLLSIKGIGPGKACLVSAAIELGRRLNSDPGSTIRSPPDVIQFIKHITLEKQEHFLCISLNGAHEILNIRTVSVGTINRCIIHPREVYSDVLKERAAAIVLAHNHPSGNKNPSENDIEITQQLFEVSKILGVHLLDHIIVCPNSYFSFAENGLVFF